MRHPVPRRRFARCFAAFGFLFVAACSGSAKPASSPAPPIAASEVATPAPAPAAETPAAGEALEPGATTPWTAALAMISDDGTFTNDTALTLFAVAFGDMPVVSTPPGRRDGNVGFADFHYSGGKYSGCTMHILPSAFGEGRVATTTVAHEMITASRPPRTARGRRWTTRTLSALGMGLLGPAAELVRRSLTLSVRLEDTEDIAWGLLATAAVLARTDQPSTVALLLGAAEARLLEIEAELKPYERTLYDATSASLRAALGEVGLFEARARGTQLSVSEAVAIASTR